MDGPTLSLLPPFSTIGHQEKKNILQSLKRPLSGYLGGIQTGGYWVEKLSEQWIHTFRCEYAIPCNSATSGLLAACMAIGIKAGSEVWTTAYSMSATAACAKVLGANVKFIDIETVRFSLDPKMLSTHLPPKAIIVTNLFGHPAYLAVLRSWCDDMGVILIEDNAQAIYAREGKRFAGTIGHIGVFSLNVHKHLQCGEGGVVVTDDPELSGAIRRAINHGELSGTIPQSIGLNLRMTEPTAAIACAQLAKVEEIVGGRMRVAYAITDMMRGIPWITLPMEDIDCKHSYYVWAGRIEDDPDRRRKFIHELNLRGFPLREGYSKPLHKLFRSDDKCPVTDRIEKQEIITYEVCAYDPKAHHLKRMKEIIDYVVEGMERCRSLAERSAASGRRTS